MKARPLTPTLCLQQELESHLATLTQLQEDQASLLDQLSLAQGEAAELTSTLAEKSAALKELNEKSSGFVSSKIG